MRNCDLSRTGLRTRLGSGARHGEAATPGAQMADNLDTAGAARRHFRDQHLRAWPCSCAGGHCDWGHHGDIRNRGYRTGTAGSRELDFPDESARARIRVTYRAAWMGSHGQKLRVAPVRPKQANSASYSVRSAGGSSRSTMDGAAPDIVHTRDQEPRVVDTCIVALSAAAARPRAARKATKTCRPR